MVIPNDIDQLILDSVEGLLNQEGEQRLSEWIESSPANRAYFARSCALWELSASTKNKEHFSAAKAWKKFNFRTSANMQIRKIALQFIRYAAVLAIGLLSGYFILNTELGKEDKQQFIYTEAPLGNLSKVILPDGSNVWLNAGSIIKYSSDFNKKDRKLFLSGEAFFEVETNKAKPFVVIASGIKVVATGTTFNVKAYSEERLIQATLAEGIITANTIDASKNDDIKLLPRQQLTIFKETISADSTNDDPFSHTETTPRIKKVEIKSDVQTQNFTSWKDENWIIANEKLGQLAVKLERRYNVKFHFENELVRNYRYSGTLKDETLDQVIAAIKITTPVNYKISGKNVTISYNKDFFKK